MAFPVDVLTNVDHETLELTAEEYMSQLPYRNTEYFSLSDSKQIEIGLCNVSFVPLYGTDTEKKLLALFSPDDSNTVVGVYLLDRWWRVEDVLKTPEPSRTGLIKVSTLGERIVLYVLNRIVLRNEKSSEDDFFLCHCEHETAKILWKDGEAIGFYSFKPKGSLCRNFVTQCYQLPVMDTIFVRKCHRGQGHAIKILEDFVGCFRNEYIGLKFPLSEAMYKVCEKYFSIYPADKEFLWEVEKTGSPFQRTLIANRLQKLKLKEKDQVVSKLNFDEDDATAPMETEFTKVQETTEYTVEIVEETIIGITKEVDDIPVTRRGRGSNLKRRAIRENSEERLSENVIRVEDLEAGVESSVEVAAMETNTCSVKESETVLRSSVDTVTATVTNFAEFRGSQKEETHEIEKDIVTATSEEIPVTHLTTAGEINNQRGSKEECEMVIKEYTIDIQGATIGSIDQSQLQSVVDIEIKMSAGTEEEKNENLGKNKEVEEDEPVCEAEMEEIKQMPDEPKEEKTVSKTEVAEQSETHAKSIEKVQAWDVEITENKERAEDEVMAESETDLTEDNRDDNTGQEKSEPKDKDTVLQQSVEVKDQIEMEADSVREVLTTEEVLCDQPKQNEAETEVSEPNKTMTNKDTLIEKASNNKLGPDEAEQVFNKSKLPQKRTSGLTPSRRSKRLRHQPDEKDLKTKSAKTGQQRSKHHSKVMMQDEDIELSTDEPEHDVSEVMEKIQEAQIENKAEAEVEEYKEKDVLTVETVSTMDAEITQVEETVFPEVSELVEREETDQEEAPLQLSVEPPEIHESKTTPEEEEETVQNSTVMLTLSEAKVVLVDLHELSPKEAGDNHGEIGILEQEEMKLTMSSEQQATEENTKPMEEPACTTTTEGYDVAADANRTPEQSTAYNDQEYEPESETTEVVLLSQVEKPEKTDFEQDKEDKQDLYEADKFPRQGNQTQKKGSIDIPSRSTRLKDQPVDSGVTVRYLRSTLNPVKITPVRRSTRSKAVIQQVESVEPQVDAKLRTDENPERENLVAEDVSPEENEKANKNADETASVKCGSSELLRAAEIDDKEKEHQITKGTGEIPLIETEAEEDVLENRVEEFKKMENKEANLAGQMDSDIEMSSLAQEVHVQEEEVPISTERHLRHRTIRVQTPLIRKSRCIQKQKAVAAVEHQERHTVVSKNKTDTILMIKETEDKMDQDVNKMENKEEHFAELEPVEEPNMSRNEYEKTSAITEETVDVCIPIITTKSSLASLDEMVNTNTEETAVPERSELPLGVEIDYQEKEFQIVDGPEEKVSLVEPDKEVENDNGTPVIKLQRPTVVLVDLSKLSQNTEGEGEASEDLTHFQTEEKLEQDKPDNSEYQLCNLPSEEEEPLEQLQKEKDTEKSPEKDKIQDENTVEEQNEPDNQDMTFEEQKSIEVLEEQNYLKVTEIVEVYRAADENVEKAVNSGEHPEKTTTMADETNIIQEAEKDHNITLKEKQTDSDIEMSGLGQESPETVQEILEEEASVSTERSLRCRTVKIQSPPIKKSRRVKRQEAEVFEDKTGTVQLIGKGDEEVHKEGAEIDKEETLQKTTVEATENIVSLIEGEPDENVKEKGFEEINNMENKETILGNEAAPEMERDKVNLEQQENEPSAGNENETAETEKPMGMDEVSVVNKEQTYGLEETTIQAEEEILQIENPETNENKNERTTRRSLRISSQSDTSTQKTRKSARLHKAELEPVKEEKMSRNEETSSMTANMVNVSVPVTIETNMENLDEDGDVSKRVETTSDEQDIDISNDKGRVDEALPEISTDIEEDETMTLIKIPENVILVEMDKTKKGVEGGIPEEEKAEPSQENTEQEQEEAVSLGQNVGETDLTNEFKTTAVEEKVTLENSEQEAAFITRSLRYQTVTVQSTPRSKSKRLHRQELESERETDDLNVPIGKDNEALIAEDSTAEFENLETKEGEGVIQTNTDGKSEKSETKDDTKEVGNEIQFEIMESNSGSQVNTEQNKSQEENLEREDMPVPNEQEEDEVSSVQKEAKPLQERENEGAAEGSTADLEETAVERRSLRKRMTVETADPRKSKRLRKQEHEDDSEQVKQAVMGQTDSVEVTFTEDCVELRSDATGAVFEDSNLGEEILQKIQKNAQGAKSDGDCNVHKDTEPDAGESQEEQKQSRINQTQADEDQEEVMTDEIVEEVIEQHVDLESRTNEGFALALEVEETSDQEENKADEESRVVMEAPKEIFTSAEKYEKGEENISDDDEKGLPIGKHVVQSSSITASARRKSMRLQMHESKTKEDESNSETEVDQTAKQRHQRKRKAITDSTSARRSKRHVRARIV